MEIFHKNRQQISNSTKFPHTHTRRHTVERVSEVHHLKVTTARGALHQMGSSSNIINDWPVKPRDPKMRSFRIDLYIEANKKDASYSVDEVFTNNRPVISHQMTTEPTYYTRKRVQKLKQS